MVSTKGGEGKSTQSANLAGFLADAGKKTLLIDGDHSQPTASSIFSLEYEAPNGLYELLMKTVDLNHPEQIISRSVIPNLDIIVSNDPHDRLSSAMLHAPDGRMRLKNVLQHPLFNEYDVIVIDSKGAASVMLELILVASTEFAVGVIKPILPDTRKFLRGTLGLMEGLLPLTSYGIALALLSRSRHPHRIGSRTSVALHLEGRLGCCIDVLITVAGNTRWPQPDEYRHPRWYVTVPDAADVVYLLLHLSELCERFRVN
jgi:hypothetical protein